MTLSRTVRLIVLGLLVATLSSIVYKRGFGWRLGASPARLESPYSTEEAWIVGEIVRDITEMSSYPSAPSPTLTSAPAGSAEGVYSVSFGTNVPPLELDLRMDVWNPAAFAGIARAALGSTSTAAAPTGSAAVSPIHPVLLDLTPASLVDANKTISRALATSMRNASAHEAAALTLGAFALRESAARSNDIRWAMNRMTAHLAIATALGGSAPPAVDARLADALLDVFANHQRRALEIIDRLRTDVHSNAVDAWTRGLRLRITQDWRTILHPANATLLEKREYFRARRATIPNTRGGVELETLHVEPGADWLRIMESYAVGVEDGWLLTNALKWERAEYEGVFQRMHGRAIGSDVIAALNMPATRLIGDEGPQVLPWGAWAEFAERHLATYMGRTDAFYRHSQGSDRRADSAKREMTRELGQLWMFPAATIWWTKGPRGGEADLTYINEAIDEVVVAPERVTATAWAFLETGAHFEPVRRGMPPARAWFMRPSPRAAYDAASRVKDSGHDRNLPDIVAMIEDAPYDYALAGEYLTTRFGTRWPYEEIQRVHNLRREYDTRVIRLQLGHVTDEAERLSLLRKSCALSAPDCASLAGELVKRHVDDEAAVSYQRAFADPSLDAVALSNWSGWLVSYYFRKHRIEDALQLAEVSAETGALQGLVTQAYLFERLGRSKDAERIYREASDHYSNPSQLLGFYYRVVKVRKQLEFEPAWNKELGAVFPNGLVSLPTDEAKPEHGVVVMKDSAFSRRAGLQAGDIIVGLEGWRVENLTQYRAVNAFYEQDEMTLTAWRGKLSPIQMTAPNRQMEIEFRTYPIEGWSEK